jgi:hypothetical protein
MRSSRPAGTGPAAPGFQRNAIAPGVLGAVAAFVGPALLGQGIHVVVLYAMAILALIVAVFAGQAGHWWWIPPMAAIAVAWNPLYPFAMAGPWWVGAHVVAGLVFLTAGALVKAPVED